MRRDRCVATDRITHRPVPPDEELLVFLTVCTGVVVGDSGAGAMVGSRSLQVVQALIEVRAEWVGGHDGS